MMRIVALLIFGSVLAACSGSSRIGSRGTTETIKHQQRHGDAASPHPGAIPADARARSVLRHSPLYRDLAIRRKRFVYRFRGKRAATSLRTSAATGPRAASLFGA